MLAENFEFVVTYLWPLLSGVISATLIFWVQRYFRSKDMKEFEGFKNEIQKDRESFLLKVRVHSESQFKIYNSLWIDLCELEEYVNDLWEKDLTAEKLRSFGRVMKNAEKKIMESALVIDTRDFNHLLQVIRTLKNYRVGKRRLIDMRDIDEESSRQIQMQIDANFDLLNEYTQLKLQIKEKMKNQLGVR